MFSVFGIGTTDDVFQELGSLPVVIERFNNLLSTGAILTAVDFNILADILSGPFALLVSSASNNSKTSSSVQTSSGGQSIGSSLSEPPLS